MSKININDVDFYFEDEEKMNDTVYEDRAGRKHRTRTRRKVENLVERKKLKRKSSNEDSYRGD